MQSCYKWQLLQPVKPCFFLTCKRCCFFFFIICNRVAFFFLNEIFNRVVLMLVNVQLIGCYLIFLFLFFTKIHDFFSLYKLRAPTQDDLQRILHVSEMRGFPGMIGSIDCMHWEWKNYPKAWEGQFTRGDKGTTTIILEAVASHDLWIWHAFFGCPGTLNDINVLDRSPVFDDVEQGKAPRVNFFVNQRPYNMAYYLADGIYPSYPTFVKSIRLPQSEPDKLFAKHQEGCRKDIERAFGVLQARFKIIREPARLWDIADLGIIMRSCIILHNMIVEDERDTYAQRWTDFEQSEGSGSSAPQPYSTEVLPTFASHVRARSELRDPNVHHELQADLVKHIWTKFGMFRD